MANKIKLTAKLTTATNCKVNRRARHKTNQSL